MITLLFILSQVLGGCHRSHAGNCARVYWHDNCEGDSMHIRPGSTRFVGHHWNDQVSSLVVKKGCRLTAWEHHNYQGGRTSFRGKVTSLRKYRTNRWFQTTHWNDRISSWECTCKSCKWRNWSADCL